MNYSLQKDLSWWVKCKVLILSLFLFFFISPLEIFSQSNTKDLENYSAKSKEDSLVFSAWDGNLYRVKELISEGVDINVKVGYGLIETEQEMWLMR